jgi:hypothetical protein
MSQINHSASFAERYERILLLKQRQHSSNNQNTTNQNHFPFGANTINDNQTDVSSMPPKFHIPPISPQNFDQNQILNDRSDNRSNSVEYSSLQNQQIHRHATNKDKDKDAPINSFRQFLKINAQRIRKEFPNMDRGEILRECRRQWIIKEGHLFLFHPSIRFENLVSFEQKLPFSYHLENRPKIVYETKLRDLKSITQEVFRRWNQLSSDEQSKYL